MPINIETAIAWMKARQGRVCLIIAIDGLLSLDICHGSQAIQFIVSVGNCTAIWVNHLRDIAISIILVLDQATTSLTNACDLAFFVRR